MVSLFHKFGSVHDFSENNKNHELVKIKIGSNFQKKTTLYILAIIKFFENNKINKTFF